MKMRIATCATVLLLLLSTLAGNAQRRNRPNAQQAAPGQFDYYLFTLSWAPEYCATHPNDAAECGIGAGFVVHGLWPQNNDGSYPEHCSNAPGLPDYSSLKDIMPDVSLFPHEWSTHGTCSGLTPANYFALERQAYHSIKIPASINAVKTETMLPPATLLMQFQQANPNFPQGSFALSCGNNRLTAIEACFAKDGKTPIACSNVRSCRAQQIKITPR